MSHINRNINSIHNYKLTPSLKKYIECLTIHDNTVSNIYIVYLHIFSSMFYVYEFMPFDNSGIVPVIKMKIQFSRYLT
jgi:hypothetical protein